MEEHVFSCAEPEKMVQRIKWLTGNAEASRMTQEKQRQRAYSLWENIQERLKQTEV